MHFDELQAPELPRRRVRAVGRVPAPLRLAGRVHRGRAVVRRRRAVPRRGGRAAHAVLDAAPRVDVVLARPVRVQCDLCRRLGQSLRIIPAK